MEAAVFYPFAGLAIFGAVGVVIFRRPTRALLSLILTLFALAVLFIQLHAPFVAMVHLIVYAGAIVVLFLFVIMLLGIGAKESQALDPSRKIFLGFSFFVPLAFFGCLLRLAFSFRGEALHRLEGSPESFGKLLFTEYLLPFELISFLLLIGVFQAVLLVVKPKVKS